MTTFIIDEEKLLEDFHNVFYKVGGKRICSFDEQAKYFRNYISKISSNQELDGTGFYYLFNNAYSTRDKYYENYKGFLQDRFYNEKRKIYYIEFFEFVSDIRDYFKSIEAVMVNIEYSSEIYIKYIANRLDKDESLIIFTGNKKLYLLDNSSNIRVFLGAIDNAFNGPYFKCVLNFNEMNDIESYDSYGYIIPELFVKYHCEETLNVNRIKKEE